MRLFDRAETQSRHDLKRGQRLQDLISFALGFVFEEHFGTLHFVYFLSQVHVILNHSFRVLICECVLAELDDLHLIDAWLR